ncbi:prephenate dehydratase domain-containing protein [Buchnera aphidicola]|nr:prephenate dehydratase domain-containing protein [Buchnera aphidicola]
MNTTNILKSLRKKINLVDESIIELLSKRQSLIKEIAKEKIEKKLKIRDEKREKELLCFIEKISKQKKLNTQLILKIFKLIILNSVLEQKKFLKIISNKKINDKTISLLGPKGSYSYIAALKYNKYKLKNYELNMLSNFKEIVCAVELNQSHYGILPLENTSSGDIEEVFNLLFEHDIFIINEFYLKIEHCLLSIKTSDIHKIKNVYSHYQPLKQCNKFIQLFPHWNIKKISSSSYGMQKIMQSNCITNAVIGSEEGAKLYGLQIIKKNISNQKKNITRFIIISKKLKKNHKNIPLKTSIVLKLDKNINNFLEILKIFKSYSIVIHKLQTHINIHKPTKKFFYLEITNDLYSNNTIKFIKEIKKIVDFIKILGCYPINNI